MAGLGSLSLIVRFPRFCLAARETAAAIVRADYIDECGAILNRSTKLTIRRNAATICGCTFDGYISRAGRDVTDAGTLAALDRCSKPYQ